MNVELKKRTMKDRIAYIIQQHVTDGNSSWELIAHFVLVALLEPTESMLKAKHQEHSKSDVSDFLDFWNAKDVWEAMIMAAINEERE